MGITKNSKKHKGSSKAGDVIEFSLKPKTKKDFKAFLKQFIANKGEYHITIPNFMIMIDKKMLDDYLKGERKDLVTLIIKHNQEGY